MFIKQGVTISLLTILLGCASGPEKTARDLLKALREDDRARVVMLCSDSTLASAEQLLHDFKDNPETSAYLIGTFWTSGVTAEQLSSWTAESLLVSALAGGNLGSLARDQEVTVQSLTEEDSRVYVLGSQTSDTLLFLNEGDKWALSIDRIDLTFSPEQILTAFLVLVEEGNGTAAAGLLDSSSVRRIDPYLNLLKLDPTASQLLAQHGIEASLQDMQAWTSKVYLAQYLSVAGLEAIAPSIPDSIVATYTSIDTAAVTAFFNDISRTALFTPQDGIWSLIATSPNLPLPSRRSGEGLYQQMWSRAFTTPIDELILSDRLVVSGNAPYGSASQDIVAGLNPLTGATCWSRSELGLEVVSESLDSSRVYIRGRSDEVISVSVLTGEVLWTYWPASRELSTSNVFDSGQEVLICVDPLGPLAEDTPSAVTCLDRETGEMNWSFMLTRRELFCMDNPYGDPTGPMERVSSEFEAFDGKTVFATTGSNIYCLDTISGDLVWRNYTSGVIGGGLSIVDSLLFTPGGGPWGWGSAFIGGVPGDDHFYCLRMENGERAWYTDNCPYLILSDAIVFFGDTIACVEQSTGDSIWVVPFETQTSGSTVISRAVSSGVAYLSSGTDLIALDLSTGSILWRTAQQDLWNLSYNDDILLATRVVDYSFPLDRWEPHPDYSVTYPTFGSSAGLTCIDATTGNILWELADVIENNTTIVHDAGLVYTQLGETVRCFSHEADGSIPLEIWSR